MCSDCAETTGGCLARLAALATLCLILLAGCSEPDSPEQQIRHLLGSAEQAIEQRSLAQAKQYLSENYQDRNNRSRRDVARLLAGYFLRHKSIHLLTQVHHIEVIEPDQDRARVVLYVAMAGRPIGSAAQLIDIRADLFRIELGLMREESDWRVHSGDWRRANRRDFLD